MKPRILISLQTQYWQLIVEAKKDYEYRRIFRNDAVTAFVYATAPVNAVVGVVEFDVPIIASIAEICGIVERQSPGSTQRMMEYMKGLDKAYAVPILSYQVLGAPVPIQEIRRQVHDFHPPQSYLILANHPALHALLQERRSGSGGKNF